MTDDTNDSRHNIPQETTAAVLSGSEPLPEGTPTVRGYDFSDPVVDYEKLLNSYLNSGFQATQYGQAVEIINDMVRNRPIFYSYTLRSLFFH